MYLQIYTNVRNAKCMQTKLMQIYANVCKSIQMHANAYKWIYLQMHANENAFAKCMQMLCMQMYYANV